MKRSPIVDTSTILGALSGVKVFIHDGQVPHPARPDIKDGDIIIRRKGGYTCTRGWDDIGQKHCWTAAIPANVEIIAEWINVNHPDVYDTITWSH